MKETRFKDTEVGRIPEDWNVRRLGDIVTLINGRAYKQEELLNSGKYKVLRVGNFFSNDNWYYSNLELNDKQYCNNGDLLYAWSCTYGAHIWNKSKTIFHYHIWKVILNSELHKVFLQYLLNNDVEEQKKTSQGSTMSHITKGFMEGRVFPIPPFSEQTRIAASLSNIDALISELGRLIEKKRAIKQGAMQQLLTGKKRLKGFSEPWAEKQLGEIANTITTGKLDANAMVEGGKYRFYTCASTYFWIDKYAFNEEALLISGNGENVGYVHYYKGKFNAYQRTYVLYGFSEDILFVKHYLQLFLKTRIDKEKSASNTPYILMSTVADMILKLPQQKEEQSAIAFILTSMDDEIAALESKKAKYEQIKQGMMQQLLTGKIRLLNSVTKTNTTSANVHFRRSVLAAEIAERLYEEPTFGHVKMEKMLFLTERLCHIDIGSHYHRDAAGPYDNRALRSIDSQLKKQKWFEVRRTEKGNRYVPMQNRGKHKAYFDKYYSAVLPTFDKIINTFKRQNTERCEIVATLYSAWEDLLHSNKPFTDADIVNEVLNNWHESKKRISQDRWLSAIQWMRENGFAPNV